MPTLQFSDNFTRSNSSLGAVGNGWVDGTSQWQINGNTVVSAGTSFGTMFLARPMSESNGNVQVRATVVPVAGNSLLLGCRGNATSHNGYVCWLGNTGSNCIAIAKIISGAIGPISSTNIAWTNGTPYVLTLTAVGNAITGTVATAAAPGTILATVSFTDTSFTAGVAFLTPDAAGPYATSFSVYTPTLTILPSSLLPDTDNNAIALAGDSLTNWVAGTPGSPAFTASSGNIDSQVIASATSATIYFSAPKTAASVAIAEAASPSNAILSVAAPTVTKIAVCAGNSLTAGTGATGGQTYPSQMAAMLGPAWQVINSGIGGQSTPQIIAGFTAQIGQFYDPSKSANVAILWEDINDRYFGATAEEAYENLVALAAKCRAKGFRVVIGTGQFSRTDFPGTSTIPGTPSQQQASFESSGAALELLVSTNWATFADAFVSRFSDDRFRPPGILENPTYFSDGVHHSSAGYGVDATAFGTGAISAIGGTPQNPLVGAIVSAIAASGSGTGNLAIVANVKDSVTAANIVGAKVSTTGQVADGVTDASGNVTLPLNAGTVGLLITANGYVGYAAPLVVTASTTVPITLVATPALPSPPVAGQCIVYFYTRDLAGNAVANVPVLIQLREPCQGTDAHDTGPQSFTSDNAGRVAVTLRQSSQYRAQVNGGSWRNFTTGTTTPEPLPVELFGDFEG